MKKGKRARKPVSLKADRIKACELASSVMSGRSDTEGLCPLLWSVTVFFENYIGEGSAATLRDFGPKKPVKLKVAPTGHAA